MGKLWILVFLLLTEMLAQDVSIDLGETLRTEQHFWLAYMKSYEAKNEDQMRSLVAQYPDWADSYARRLMTGYLSFCVRQEKEVAQKNLDVAKSIAIWQKKIHGNGFLLTQLLQYERFTPAEKRKALLAILSYHQARESGNTLYLFSLHPEYASALDEGQISEKLEIVLQAKKLGIAWPMQKIADKKGVEWLWRDQEGKKYLFIRREDKILLYRIELFEYAIELFQEIEDHASLGFIFLDFGKSFQARGNLQEARHYFTQSLKAFEALGDAGNKAGALNHLGLIAYAMKEYDQARKYYDEALSLARSVDMKAAMASSLNNLGALYEAQKKYPEAQKFFAESLSLYYAIEDLNGQATSLHNLGVLCYKQQDYAKAKDDLSKSLLVTRKLHDVNGILHTLSILIEMSLALSEEEKAREYLEESLELHQKQKSSLAYLSTLQQLAHLAQKRNDPDEETKYEKKRQEIAKELGDTESQKEAQSRLAALEEQKEKETRRKIYTVAAGIGGILLFLILVTFWFFRKQKEAKRIATKGKTL